MIGDSRAQTMSADLSHRFPDDTLLRNVWAPCVVALAAMNRKSPDQAIDALRAATPYDLAIFSGLLPIYVRGLVYLEAKRGPEAATEFQKIIDHRGIAPVGIEHSLAKLGLGRAYILSGDNARAKSAYQDFFAVWKDADPDIPILKEAKAEYVKLK